MTRPLAAVPKTRLNLDMHPEVKAELEATKVRIRADSMGEVIRRSLALYTLMLDAQENNEMILIKQKGSLAPARQILIV